MVTPRLPERSLCPNKGSTINRRTTTTTARRPNDDDDDNEDEDDADAGADDDDLNDVDKHDDLHLISSVDGEV